MSIVKDYVEVLLGLSTLGFYDDPYIEEYKKNDNLLSNSSSRGISIDGIRIALTGKFSESNNPPPQGRLCYVALYELTSKGLVNFPKAAKRLMDANILSKEFPLEEIVNSEEYKKRISS